MKNRIRCLSAALALALLSMLTAACLSLLLNVPAAPETTTPVLAAGELSLPTDDPIPYTIRSVDDEVCIFQGDTLLIHTGVSVSLLPRQDREALEAGIQVESEADLTALLEDLGS